MRNGERDLKVFLCNLAQFAGGLIGDGDIINTEPYSFSMDQISVAATDAGMHTQSKLSD